MNFKRFAGIVLGLSLVSADCAIADRPSADMTFNIHGLLPKEKEDWNYAGGIEMAVRFWNSSDMGMALVLGMDSWQAKSEYTEEEDEYGYLATSIYGTSTLIPIGVSALYRSEIHKNMSLILEAGLRYVFVDSGVQAETAYEDSTESLYYKEAIQTDNAFLGVVGIGLEAKVGNGLSICGGLRYQLDLIEPHEQYMGEDLGATSFQAASVNIGVTWKF